MTPEGSVVYVPDRPVASVRPVEGVIASGVATCAFVVGALKVSSAALSALAVLLAIHTGVVLAYQVRASIILMLICTWAKRHHKFAIIVGSESTTWKKRIELDWLPTFQTDVAYVKWYTHSRSSDDVPSLVFLLLAGTQYEPSQRDYCPVVVVPTGLGVARVYRFFRPFKRPSEADEDLATPQEELLKSDYSRWATLKREPSVDAGKST